MGIGFDEFKSYFEFGLEVTGVVGGIGTAIYKFDCINALFRIARGRANSADETLAIADPKGRILDAPYTNFATS
jgi:hypothetical protein